ncbi:MAG TPA: diaminopimelate decarboxylase [Candidatus Kapabacteria bacterium]|nr:diaminopimelate decarboxylase [Candidatus Kapabacteria bacterium]
MSETIPQYYLYRGDRLYCEEVALDALAEQYGTPLYVYSKAQLLSNVRQYRDTLAAEDPRHYLSYALKANANNELLKILKEENVGADIVSAGELLMARHAGFPAEKITYAGVGKRDDEILLALDENIKAFYVESEEELSVIDELAGKRNKRARISIRVNPDVDAQSHPYISTGMLHNKFGIPIGDALRIYKEASHLSHIQVAGLHTHIGSQITSTAPFINAARSIAQFIGQLKSEGIPIEHVNFGGGQGIDYYNIVHHPFLPQTESRASNIPAPAEFLKNIFPVLRETGCSLIFEPGRAIVANSGTLLTRVLFIKQNPVKHFTIVDAAMNDLIRPSLYNAYHQIVPASIKESKTITTDVVGPICETSDFLARDRVMPQTNRGDLLAVMCTGAYGYSLASNYNMRPRAAEVLVEGKTFRVIRKREDMTTLIEQH